MGLRRIRSGELVVAIALFATTWGAASASQGSGVLAGSVMEAESGRPLPYALVRVVGEPLGTMTDEEGSFVIREVPTGVQALEATLIGYRTQRLDGLSLSEDGRLEVRLLLERAVLTLREVVVTPGRVAIMKSDPMVRQTLTEDEINTIPHFGEDIYRAVTRIPGVSGNDISAKFTVRGGEHEEVLVLLDGLELYEPFHLKDILGGVLSIVEVTTIEGIDMMSGGFPARYGNHMSGVFDISSVTPAEKERTAVGISLMNARFYTEGRFDEGRGSWLLSARRGYLDIVMKMVEGGEISPVYYDLHGKLQYRLNDLHALSAHVLYSDDDLEASDEESGDNLGSDYGNRYAWLGLKSTFGSSVSAHTVASVGQVTRRRHVEDFEAVWHADGNRVIDRKRLGHELRETREFSVLGFKQDWHWELSARQLMSAGLDLKRLDSEYDYFNRQLRFVSGSSDSVEVGYDTIAATEKPDGTSVGLHLGTRYRLADPLTVEVGARYDRMSYTGDADVSPRANLSYSFGDRTVVRTGWGWFHQAQDINDLDVPYGDATLYRSQRAEHRVLGLEHSCRNGVLMRVEAYQKRLSHVRPRYENLSKDMMFAPELEEVNVFLEPESGEVRGLEVYVKRDMGGRFSWWGSYALSRARERLDGIDVPKNQDQRHTIYLDCRYNPGRAWEATVAWQYHSGWPYTERRFVRIDVPEGEWPFRDGFGPRNAVRLPAYHRLDARLSRHFELKGGRLSCFLEIVNLYDRENVRDILPGDRRRIVDGELVADSTVNEEWFPLLPSVGVSWEF